jgi:hypothetical protein
MRKLTFIIVIFGFVLSEAAIAAPEIADDELRQVANELSASTLVGGDGWKVYDRLLHPNYSRWAMGEVYEGRTKFVNSLEEWWDYGMRVAERDIEMVAVDTVGDLAIIRFKTTEKFVGPDGPTVGFSGYVSNIWTKENGVWLLLSAEISSGKE